MFPNGFGMAPDRWTLDNAFLLLLSFYMGEIRGSLLGWIYDYCKNPRAITLLMHSKDV
jgi:hypothetical protein